MTVIKGDCEVCGRQGTFDDTKSMIHSKCAIDQLYSLRGELAETQKAYKSADEHRNQLITELDKAREYALNAQDRLLIVQNQIQGLGLESPISVADVLKENERLHSIMKEHAADGDTWFDEPSKDERIARLTCDLAEARKAIRDIGNIIHIVPHVGKITEAQVVEIKSIVLKASAGK